MGVSLWYFAWKLCKIMWTKHGIMQIKQQEVCLFYSQNNKIVWLSNMADTSFEKFTRCAKVCGLSFLNCALRMLIGWAVKLQSHGCNKIGSCMVGSDAWQMEMFVNKQKEHLDYWPAELTMYVESTAPGFSISPGSAQVACTISDALISWILADEEPLCGNAAI